MIAHTTIILPFLSWMLISFYSRDIFLIESAARSDGATRFQAFYLIALPLIAPGLIAAPDFINTFLTLRGYFFFKNKFDEKFP